MDHSVDIMDDHIYVINTDEIEGLTDQCLEQYEFSLYKEKGWSQLTQSIVLTSSSRLQSTQFRPKWRNIYTFSLLFLHTLLICVQY